ncbi:response regulator transcription factor [Lactobacillus sp. DCY120]|uniref:Response regulator transcription factor n=1 Tax=Bombilactobacillus apium TaxID=2675299 RepID=A0A850QZD0_9LACO|nr:LytTR family DNA-binding domain-containing protein [Bombilactobacillus apium]NVY96129.1 response regulator transcription factor [Bombilactobacillus apium]
MNVYILEDDLFQRQKLATTVNQIITENKWPLTKVSQTSKPQEILTQISNGSTYNLYLLDIQIKNNSKSGLELAQKIRSQDEMGIIVFVTTHSEFAARTYAYKVSAFDFIDKTWSPAIISDHLTDALNSLYKKTLQRENKAEMFNFQNQNSNFRVPFNDILYFETTSISHKLKLICKDRVISFYASMKSIVDLDDRFVQCHRSYIINLANVTQIDRRKNLVFFSKNQHCLITRRKIKSVLEQLQQL